MLAALKQTNDFDSRWIATLQRLPRPWSAGFGYAILRRIRDHSEQLRQQGGAAYYNEPWLHTLGTIALALPRECFPEALALQDRAGAADDPTMGGWWQRNIDDFGELIRTRQRLMKEIPL